MARRRRCRPFWVIDLNSTGLAPLLTLLLGERVPHRVGGVIVAVQASGAGRYVVTAAPVGCGVLLGEA